MTPSSHPDYISESQQLQRTLAAVDQYAEALEGRTHSAAGADDRTTYILRSMFRQQLDPVRYMQSSPYFGRIDICEHNGTAKETYYIGEYHLDYNGVTIVSWQAPIAALFYKELFGSGSYRSLNGDINCQLELKRRLTVLDRKLTDIRDIFARRTHIGTSIEGPEEGSDGITSSAQRASDPDEFLRSVLSGRASTRLKQIVTSIQAEQYALIEASPNQALIVQGVAGSGKTSIALHRLSYLLYPGNAQDVRATNCIVFGPNRLFLNYTSALLPRLGIENIVQTTPAAWAMEHIEAGIRDWQKEQNEYRPGQQQDLLPLRLRDATLEALLSMDAPRERKRILYLRSRIKASRTFATLLERYIEHLRHQVRFPIEGWTFENVDVGVFRVNVSLSQPELVDSFRQYASRPLVDHRQRFRERCRMLIENAYYKAIEQTEYHAEDITRDRHQSALTNLKNRVDRRIYNTWRPLNVIHAYNDLLTTPELIERLGADLFSEHDLELLLASTDQDTPANLVDHSDLPALHFLQLLAAPPDGDRYDRVLRYDHIVIDEAQDVSALEYQTILRFYARRNSCTILGDLPQSIYSYRGISSWNEVKDVFPDGNFAYSELRHSYRTTYEIAELADGIIRKLEQKRKGLPRIEPFARHGAPVRLQGVSDNHHLLQLLKNALATTHDAGHRNIAIIAKSAHRCTRIVQALSQENLPWAVAVADTLDFDYQGGVVILPIHLAKGVEFDVAVVVDADDTTYSDTEFDGRLLYVAVTRAMHELYILWEGNRSTYLEYAEGLPFS